MKFIVRVTDCGPLSFRSGRETTSPKTLEYVPGSVLMGGLAATHALLYNDADQHDAMFFHEETSFGNLYPERFEKSSFRECLIQSIQCRQRRSVASVFPVFELIRKMANYRIMVYMTR